MYLINLYGAGSEIVMAYCGNAKPFGQAMSAAGALVAGWVRVDAESVSEDSTAMYYPYGRLHLFSGLFMP
jgi:hypothetical protein